ncbi:unnamed protein product [Umbelopsis vinacea]
MDLTETEGDSKENNVSEYELRRQRNIMDNQNLLKDLGLMEAIRKREAVQEIDVSIERERKYGGKRMKAIHYKAKVKEYNAEKRVSRRLLGQAPEDINDLENLLDDEDRIRNTFVSANVRPLDPTASLWRGKKQHTGYLAEIPVPKCVSTPLTLGMSDYAKRSFDLCMFRHPYPIGYRASKVAFGEVYTMTISKGETGPIFTIEGEASGKLFSGATPTAPWTEACKKSKSQGTRVSGPLFYGFSDAITMKLLEEMEGYETASVPEEEESLPEPEETSIESA